MSETFDEFLASRPQLVRDPDARPVPGWCDCPRWSIGDKPIFHRHAAGCDATGEATEAFTFVGADRVMKATTLEALAAWIPAPPAPPAQDPAATTIVIKRMLSLGFHLVALPVGTKKPRGRGWNDPEQTPALTFEQAMAHVNAGGGLGVLLGPSDLIVIDAENAAATAALVAAGYTPVLYTAKGMNPVRCDPRANKIGGGHFWFRRPSSIPAEQLSNVPQKVVGDGGLVDVLAAPGSMAVVPPTALVEAAGWRYTAEGRNRLWHGEDELSEAPMWLFDPAAGCPTGLENLHGGLVPKAPVERVAHDEGSQELTDAVDGIEWDAVEALDDRLEDWGDADDDGCPVRHWRGADHRKSVTMHGCGRGRFAHVWSGTMRAALGMGDRESVSPLSLACLLLGKDDRGADVREVAQRFGLRLGGEQELDTITPDSLEEAAAELEAAAEAGGRVESRPTTGTRQPDGSGQGEVIRVEVGADGLLRRAAAFRSAAVVMRARQHVVAPQSGAVLIGAGSVVGLPAGLAQAPTVGGVGSTAPVVPSAPQEPLDVETVEGAKTAETAPAVDDAVEGELVEGTDNAAEARRVFRELRPKIREIERQMRDTTPGLKRAWDYAESEGVFMHGLVGALLPRIMASVPPNVVLPPRNGLRTHKVKGQGLNQYGVVVAPSSAGKGETDNAAEAAVPLQLGVATTTNGTSEHWSKLLRGRKDGVDYIKTTSLLAQVDELDTFNAYLTRPDSKMPGWIASTWMNGYGGQGTSDEKNAAVLPKHGSRIGLLVNGQPGKMDVLAAMSAMGVGPRFYKCLAGLVHKADRGPLYGIPVAPVMADQSGQPWYSLGHVGEPPIPCQQPLAARDAGTGLQAAPLIVNKGDAIKDDDGAERLGVTGFDDAEPIWIDLPQCALDDIEAGLEISAERAADWGEAFDQDQEGLVSGHRVPMQMHIAAALMVLDGEHVMSSAHWEAAGLFLIASDLTAAACAAYMELSGEAEAYRLGQLKGVGYAASKAAEATVTSRGVQSAMKAIVSRLRICGGTAMPGYLRSGSDGTGNLPKFGAMSKLQRAHMAQGFAVLEQAGQARLNADGSWSLAGPLAIVA